jgi:hypothetical protein
MSDHSTQVKGTAAEKPEAQLSLTQFRLELADAANISTIGISTAEGVSPRNAALEKLTWRISLIPAAAEQAEAMREILRESNTLPSDQHAHLIATVVHETVLPDRIALRTEARPLVGEILLQAGLDVAQRLVPESLAYVVLRLHLQRLVNRAEYNFGDDVYDRLDEVGFNNPALVVGSADAAEQSPLHRAEWLRGRIDSISTKQITAEDLDSILHDTASLSDELRGDILTRLVNRIWNITRIPANEPLVEKLTGMVEALPPTLRITSLEAYFNQMNRIPHQLARTIHPRILKAVEALPSVPNLAWFDRSRADLVQVLQQQGLALKADDFVADETLIDRDTRIGKKSDQGSFRLFSQMSGQPDQTKN